LLRPGRTAVLSVLVQNMGQNDDWTAEETRHRQPRGLVGAAITGATAPISWRIQGARGGEDLVDPARGPLNTGGLYGERSGWHLPESPDRGWARAGTAVGVGVSWRRTSFRLDLPRRQDTSVLLRFDDPPPAGQRVTFFLNGWNFGQYGADIGPQTDFVLPAGLLRERGENTLAFSVIADRAGTLRAPRLVVGGTHRGGVPVTDVTVSRID
jgi:hypothetical protein